MLALVRAAMMAVLFVGTGPALGAGNVTLPRFPSVSPDGSHVVFSWRGDLWKVDSEGGSAVRLTSNPADELFSAWSRDGALIAFTSSRSGPGDLFVMNADGTNVRQVTAEDRPLALSGFSSDNSALLASASREGDVYRAVRPYAVPVVGGPIGRLFDAFGEAPVMSPDGQRVAFVRGGSSWWRAHYRGADHRDVWIYSMGDATFKRLTEWTGNDGMPRWKDSRTIIFASDREDRTVNLYELGIDEADGRARRLTRFTDGTDVESFDVAPGALCVMHAWDSLYTLDLTGRPAPARPLHISASEDEADNFSLRAVKTDVSEAAVNPDGESVAIIAYGEVFIRGTDEDSPARRIEMGESRERQIAWSPDGLSLYFVSDADGTESIYRASVKRTRSDIKEQIQSLAPDEEPEGGPVEEEEEEEAETDDEDDQAKDPGRWSGAIAFTIEPVVQSALNDRDPAPSPDGTKLAFRRTRGDLMILDLETGEESLFHESWDWQMHFAWAPASDAIAFGVSDMDYNMDIWLAPLEDPSRAVNITRHPDNEWDPVFGADGRVLIFCSERVSDEADVWMVYLDRDIESLNEQDLEDYYENAVEAAKKREPLSHDEEDEEGEPADEADEEADADDADADDADAGDADAGEDGDEEGADEESDDEDVTLEVAAFDELDLDDAYLRLSRVTTLIGNEGDLAITPGGDRYIFSATDAGGDGSGNQRSTFSLKWDRSERKRLADDGSVQGVTLTGDKVVIVSGGRAGTVPPDGGDFEHLDVDERIRIDLQRQSAQKFREASRVLGDNFYHHTMKDLDWDALTDRFLELAESARTPEEFQYVGRRFIGRLAASHLNIFFPPTERNPNVEANGRLGVDATATREGFVVERVIDHSPASDGDMALLPGDVITSVEMKPVDLRRSLEAALKGRAGKETIITVLRMVDGERREIDLLLEPISYGAETTLRYNDWQRERARLVDEWSGGRVGYLHIRAMGLGALFEFERDLYAAANDADGLIIDVRNNGGGWTTDLVLASIMAEPHAYTIPRGGNADDKGHYPRDRFFIQRYARPVNMVCNEKSYSNAEIISHAFKTLERGTLVGVETNGSVISTGGQSLIDGTWVRMPFPGWYLLDDTDMEDTGAVPHLPIDQTPEDESREYDAQLKAAVDDLIQRLD